MKTQKSFFFIFNIIENSFFSLRFSIFSKQQDNLIRFRYPDGSDSYVLLYSYSIQQNRNLPIYTSVLHFQFILVHYHENKNLAVANQSCRW